MILKVFNSKTGNFETVRAFLDHGSNITVISKRCALRCGLSTLGSDKMFISTFGKSARKLNVERTVIDFYENPLQFENHVPVNAYIMDDVVNDITAYALSERQKNFVKDQHIQLADPDASENKLLKVDILLGQNCVHLFNKGEPIYMPGGSVLLPSWGEKYILAGTLDSEYPADNYESHVAPHFIAVHSVLSEFGGLKNLELSRRLVKNINHVYSCISSEEELEIIDTFRNFEILGISPSDYNIDPILEDFNKSAEFDGKRYTVRLPFKEPQIKKLSNNFLQAFQRLMSGHKRRLKSKFSDEREKYAQSFKDELERGILEKVETLGTIEEINAKLSTNPQYFNQLTLSNGRPCCYLPHQAVYKSSTGKFRRVHDGKARPYKSAYSLNDCLEKGPNLMTSILHILIGFRKERWAASADIEKAFPQVAIHLKDRDVLRCLWVEDGKVCVYRFARLPFGLSCSPFILQATLRKHLGENNIDEKTLQNFLASLYVDDSVWSEQFLEDLYKRKDLYTEIFAECGMNFRDWTSNHPEAREFFAKLENRDIKSQELVLGMKWDVLLDYLCINANKLEEVLKRKLKTKRDLWKIIPSIYDPLGLISPYILLGKMIVSDACKEVHSWDGRLPQKFVDLTKNWVSEFENIENVKWNRFAGIENAKRVQLYGCCDASGRAMGACIYAVCTAQDGKISCNLLASKTRNAPVGEHSIPRLELASAVLLTNLMGHVSKVYNVDSKDITYFTDSADVIFWVYSGHYSWRPFVANQLKKLKKASDVLSWRHIDTLENPADLASRGEKLGVLDKSELWRSGPEYWKTGDLSKGKSKLSGYDKHYKDLPMSEVCGKELNSSLKKQLSSVMCPVVTVASLGSIVEQGVSEPDVLTGREIKNKLKLPRIDKIIVDYNQDSKLFRKFSYDHLMEVTERVLGVVSNMSVSKKRKVSENISEEKLSLFSSKAEILWIQATQQEYFHEIFLLLENPKAKVSAFSRNLFNDYIIFLDPEMKVLRCRTRNEHALLNYSTIYPILLPSMVKDKDGVYKNCVFSELLVRKIHENVGVPDTDGTHIGVPDTLARVRSEFWILKGRNFVKKLIGKCVKCREVQGAKYSVARSPSLPEFRVVRNKPFSGTGVDFVGPFKIRDTPRGKITKGWYLSFVCGSTRAVHIEAVRSRQIGDFLNALSRFMSERGIPISFISDHEGSFKRASQELEQIVKSKRVQKYLKTRRISWNFYTEKSPNKGGFIETLNKPIKRAFYKTLKNKIITFEDFRTIAVHVHSTVNDRPLTYMYSDIASENKALTPSMLLRGYNINEPPHLNLHKQADESETKISETYLYLEKIKDTYWRIFNKLYLTELFERHVRQKKANKELVVPKLGEVCLLAEEKIPRRDWRLARVVGINEKRGSIREVTVQTLSPGGGLITKLKRSPDKLVPLEVSSEIKVLKEDLVPLEGDPRDFVKNSKRDLSYKYTKAELARMKKAKIWPPYTRSKQFIDPSSINTGDEPDFINKSGSKKVDFELPRNWR